MHHTGQTYLQVWRHQRLPHRHSYFAVYCCVVRFRYGAWVWTHTRSARTRWAAAHAAAKWDGWRLEQAGRWAGGRAVRRFCDRSLSTRHSGWLRTCVRSGRCLRRSRGTLPCAARQRFALCPAGRAFRGFGRFARFAYSRNKLLRLRSLCLCACLPPPMGQPAFPPCVDMDATTPRTSVGLPHLPRHLLRLLHTFYVCSWFQHRGGTHGRSRCASDVAGGTRGMVPVAGGCLCGLLSGYWWFSTCVAAYHFFVGADLASCISLYCA